MQKRKAQFWHFEKIHIQAVLIFIISALVLTVGLTWYKNSQKPNQQNIDAATQQAINNLQQQQLQDSIQRKQWRNNYPQKTSYNKTNANITQSLFIFDPNTATAYQLQQLGLSEKVANTIQNYTSKGGKFYQPEDIAKIWGITDEDVERLLPYIKIAPRATNNNYNNTYTNNYTNNNAYKPKEKTVVEVNTTDTSALIALPGIGSKLAARIVNYRNKLGGFYNLTQVAETYGLPDSTFQRIKDRLSINSAALKTININTATIDELKVHPYIKYHLANAIVQYRTQHGPYQTLNDLKKIAILTEEVLEKVAPYLVVQ
jgi:competence protein ComEA